MVQISVDYRELWARCAMGTLGGFSSQRPTVKDIFETIK